MNFSLHENQLSFIEQSSDLIDEDQKKDPKQEKITQALSELDLNNLTPIQALQELNELRQLLQ